MSDVVCRSLQYTNRLNYGVSHDLDDLALKPSPLRTIIKNNTIKVLCFMWLLYITVALRKAL
jgi:hypothetical protein